jgi:hypothetical protein
VTGLVGQGAHFPSVELDRRLRSRVAAAVLFSAVGLAAELTYVPTSTTETFGLTRVAGLFLIFLFWLAAVVGWGRATSLLIGASRRGSLRGAESWALALGLGSLFAACWAWVTVSSGLRGPIPSSVFLVAGLLAFAGMPGVPLVPRTRRQSVLIALLASYVVLRFVQSTRLSRHGDPLYYHLVAPVLWLRSGAIGFDPQHPLSFQASLWEYLYLWPSQLFLGKGETGLPAIQIFAQWTHLTLGWVGMGLAVIALLRGLRYPPVIALIGGFAALATRSPWWTGALAKNDCGAALWLLCGAVLLWGRDRSRTRNIAAGVFIGAAFVAKYTIAFTLLPLLLGWVLFRLVEAPKKLPLALSGALLGVSLSATPLLVRNFHGTGAALFPFSFSTKTLSTLSESSREYLYRMAPYALDAHASWRIERLRELAHEGTLAIVSLAIPLFLARGLLAPARSRAFRRRSFSLFFAAFGSLLCFLAIARPGTDFRLLGPGIVLLNVSGTLIALLALRFLSRRAPALRLLPSGLVVLGAVAATSRIAPEAVLDRIRELPLQRELAGHTAGDAKLWLATNVPETERIVTTGDNEIYYMLGHDVSVATDDLSLDRLWRREVSAGASGERILEAFRSRGFRYLLDTRFPGEPFELSTRLAPTLDRHPGWVAFRGDDSKLVDLGRVGSDVLPR